jgi:hypothetical protein
MHDEAGHVALGLHLPELLQADAVNLRPAAFAQLEALLEQPAEVAAAPLGKDRVLGVQLEPGLVAAGLLAVAPDAHVAGRDAAHAAVVAIKDLGRRESRIDLHARGLGLVASQRQRLPRLAA